MRARTAATLPCDDRARAITDNTDNNGCCWSFNRAIRSAGILIKQSKSGALMRTSLTVDGDQTLAYTDVQLGASARSPLRVERETERSRTDNQQMKFTELNLEVKADER